MSRLEKHLFSLSEISPQTLSTFPKVFRPECNITPFFSGLGEIPPDWHLVSPGTAVCLSLQCFSGLPLHCTVKPCPYPIYLRHSYCYSYSTFAWLSSVPVLLVLLALVHLQSSLVWVSKPPSAILSGPHNSPHAYQPPPKYPPNTDTTIHNIFP